MLRILIADDDAEVRSALRILLKHQPDLEVISEAAATLDLAGQLAALRPDVLLLDWGLIESDSNGLADLRDVQPDLRIIIISGQSGVQQAALKTGAAAFVSKGDPPERLLTALRQLHDETTNSI
jgi:DNA-binding NarL/FixJ family response regulator